MACRACRGAASSGLIDLGRDATMYYFVLAVFVAVYLFIRRIVHSPFGQVLKAIRENEPRAISLGYEVDRYKLAAFVLSASIAGLAGSLKALVLGFVTLSDVSQGTSGDVILMTLLGGSGTFLGPVVGAGIVVTLQEYLSEPSGRLGFGHYRRHLRGLRDDLPARLRGRNPAALRSAHGGIVRRQPLAATGLTRARIRTASPAPFFESGLSIQERQGHPRIAAFVQE